VWVEMSRDRFVGGRIVNAPCFSISRSKCFVVVFVKILVKIAFLLE
jgi:hypothetical protein